MEPDWAQEISRKVWTEQITHKYPHQDPEPYHYYDPSPHLSFWPEWLDKWLQNSGLFLRRLHKYTELKKM